jgi:hypothetical protein
MNVITYPALPNKLNYKIFPKQIESSVDCCVSEYPEPIAKFSQPTFCVYDVPSHFWQVMLTLPRALKRVKEEKSLWQNLWVQRELPS